VTVGLAFSRPTWQQLCALKMARRRRRLAHSSRPMRPSTATSFLEADDLDAAIDVGIPRPSGKHGRCHRDPSADQLLAELGTSLAVPPGLGPERRSALSLGRRPLPARRESGPISPLRTPSRWHAQHGADASLARPLHRFWSTAALLAWSIRAAWQVHAYEPRGSLFRCKSSVANARDN
jgi:hypothetical protein